MNRREAIAALTSLPGLTAISKASLKPNDVLVLECDGPVSQDTADRLKTIMEEVWPGHRCVVLERGFRLKVVEG